jgi:hypothetical protein
MENVGIFYGHLVYFMASGIFYGFWVNFKVIWYNLTVLVSCSKKNITTLVERMSASLLVPASILVIVTAFQQICR